MKIELLLNWYDFRIGVFWDATKTTLCISPVPMLSIKIQFWGPRCYVLKKRGYFYRPNAAGYTDRFYEAGRFTLAEAVRHEYPYDEPVTKHHVKEFV